MRRLLVLGLLGLCAAVPDRAPPPIALTADEQATIAAREPVIRFDPSSETGGGVVGVVDVAAPVDATWAALLDLPARVGEVGGLVACAKYLDEPRRIGARWEIRILASTTVFHVLYELDPDQRFVRFHLDPTKDNELARVDGAYQLYPVDGRTRLVYWSETDTGHPVPQWLKRWVATGSLGEQLAGIRARAERAR